MYSVPPHGSEKRSVFGMKKNWTTRLMAGIAAGTMVFSLAGCGSSSDGKKSADKEKFIVGFDAAFPPYGYQDENGEYVGFDLDLAAEVCKRNDWELVKQPIDWNAKDMELNSGTISCIWNGFTMNGREDEYAWTDPYVDNSQVFVVKADSGIATFADLAGKSVAVQTDSSAEAALKEDDNKELKDSFKELVVVSDYNTAFMNLDSNAVEAIAMDIGVAKYQMESRDGEYKILDDVLSAEQYAVGFAKNNTELRDKVQKTLDEMRKDGKFAEIAEKWDLTDSVID
jgi:extracellular solute-binding protein family 3